MIFSRVLPELRQMMLFIGSRLICIFPVIFAFSDRPPVVLPVISYTFPLVINESHDMDNDLNEFEDQVF
jgi:hypothetical protein